MHEIWRLRSSTGLKVLTSQEMDLDEEWMVCSLRYVWIRLGLAREVVVVLGGVGDGFVLEVDGM